MECTECILSGGMILSVTRANLVFSSGSGNLEDKGKDGCASVGHPQDFVDFNSLKPP